MELEPADETMRRILKRYDKDPMGWQVLVGRSAGGFQDLFFIQSLDQQIWQIKQHYLNPYKVVGFGAELEGMPRQILESPDFGLRPIPQIELARMFDEKTTLKALQEALNRSPVPTREAMQGDGLLSGPIIQFTRTPVPLSRQQEELDLKLKSELEKFLWKHYPERMRLSV